MPARVIVIVALLAAGIAPRSRGGSSTNSRSARGARIRLSFSILSDRSPRWRRWRMPAPVAAERPNPLANDPTAVAEGHKLFISMNCAGCHGYDAKGGMGPNLTDTYWRYGGTPERLYESILNGRPKGMPAWGVALPPQHIWQLVAYIQSLGGAVAARHGPGRGRGKSAGQGSEQGGFGSAMKRLFAVAGVCLPLCGCRRRPLGYLSPAGPAARVLAASGGASSPFPPRSASSFWALLSYAIGREETPDARALGGGSDRSAIRWIAAGTGISTVFLLGSAIWTLSAVRSVTNATTPPALTIDVTGHEWWWEAHYHSNNPSREFTTANDLVIPVGVPVQVNLRSSDVIHSFWVPRLAGKTDTIPGVTNRTRIEADQPGIYRGQCTEFCGLEHAHMAFFVVAMSQADFNAWWDRQLQRPRRRRRQ